MAKKTVAGLRQLGAKDFTKVVKMVKSPKTGAYSFREEVMPKDKVKDFLDIAFKHLNLESEKLLSFYRKELFYF